MTAALCAALDTVLPPTRVYSNMSHPELDALCEFTSGDENRPHQYQPWRYDHSQGELVMATDGHSVCIRTTVLGWREITWDNVPSRQLGVLPPRALEAAAKYDMRPAPWQHVLRGFKPSKTGPGHFGINPEYMGRVARVEKVATKVERDLMTMGVHQRKSKADLAKAKRETFAFATFAWMGADGMSPLSFSVKCPLASVEWFGLIMPRST